MKKIGIIGHDVITATFHLPGIEPKVDPIKEVEVTEECQKKFGIEKIFVARNEEEAQKFFDKPKSKFHK